MIHSATLKGVLLYSFCKLRTLHILQNRCSAWNNIICYCMKTATDACKETDVGIVNVKQYMYHIWALREKITQGSKHYVPIHEWL